MPLRSRWLWLGFVGAACVGYQWLVHALVVIVDSASVRVALTVLNGVPHAAINLFMLWVFGRTLRAGREPLITGFARRVHGALPGYLETYTRNTTIAWCVFFAAQVVVSLALLAAASVETWSLFVNVMSFPLIAVMFVGEYLYRVARFRDFPHSSIWQGIRSFVTHRDVAHPADGGSSR